MGLKISCDEATTICDKSQYKEATFLELLKLNLHLLWCKVCKRYTKQNALVTKICEKHVDKEDSCLSDTDKKELEELLKNNQ